MKKDTRGKKSLGTLDIDKRTNYWFRTSARAEFEQIKGEVDPLIVGQFIITWKDVVIRMHEKVNEVNMKMAKFVDETRTDNKTQRAFDPFK